MSSARGKARATAAWVALSGSLFSNGGRAQVIARGGCIDAGDLAPALERVMADVAPGPLSQMEILETTCNDAICVVRFAISARSPDCAGEYPPTRVRRPGMRDFTCEVAREDCATEASTSPSGERSAEIVAPVESASDPMATLTDCVRRAVAMARAASEPCPRMQPISDPIAPPPAPRSRAGFDLGMGWRWGNLPLQRPLLIAGTSMDFSLASWISAGVRLGYLAASGDATDRDGDGRRESNAANYHAVDSAGRLRARFGGTVGRLELEAAFGPRLTLSGPVSSHLTLGGGATVYWARFGLGLQYVRSLENGGLDQAVFLTTQRNSPLDVDERAFASRAKRAPRVGLGLHAILTGWGFAEHAGPMLPGAAVELPVLLADPVVAVVRYDLLWFPAIDAPGFVAQTVLGGIQFLHFDPVPIGVGALIGYAVVDGRTPRVVSGGPVADGGAWYWLDPLGVHLGLHGRWGLTEVNRDLRTVYVSLGARQIF